MPFAFPVQKIARLLVGVIFLTGTTAIAWHFHDKAYDDLPTFYWATHLAYDDEISAYQPQHFQQLSQALDRKIYPFLYPPPSLVIFTPFLLGGYEQIKAVFTFCNLVLWWMLTWLMYRLYCFYIRRKEHFLSSILVPLCSLGFFPVIDTFRTGQVNLFVLACVTPLFFQSSRHTWQYLSGILFAIAIVLKVYLLLALPVLIVMRQKKILVAVTVTLVFLCAASLVLFPYSMWAEWFSLGNNSGGYGKQLPSMMTIPWNQSLNGFFIRQFLDERILTGETYWHWIIYICSFALLVMTFYTVSRHLRHHSYGVSIAMTLVFLMTIMVAPLTWLHHYVFAIPAIVCCFALLSNTGKSIKKKAISIAVVAAVTVVGFPTVVSMLFPAQASWGIINGHIPFQVNLVMSAQLLSAIVFFGLFCAVILRSRTA